MVTRLPVQHSQSLRICDHEYRLLSVAVGVPDANELATLIEDAEETRVFARGCHRRSANADRSIGGT